jgi:hypothetical protein
VQAHTGQPGPLCLVSGDPVAWHAAPLEVEDVCRAFTTPDGRWKPLTAGGVELFNIATVPVTRYRYRGSTILSPWDPDHA